MAHSYWAALYFWLGKEGSDERGADELRHGASLPGLTRFRSDEVCRARQPGAPVRESLRRLVHSVAMVLTVNDPPRFDPYALPILAGAGVAVLSLAGVPKLRDLPAAAVLFFFASIAGAFVAAGWTYTGRFSIHVMPITCAVTACAAATLTRGREGQR